MNLSSYRRIAAAGAALLLAGSAARHAEACGGTFCDGGPQAMPVDQTGENILFAMDGTTVEAHIQIQYEGEAMRFAWLLPLPAVPELAIGSQLLFLNLLNGTVPSYGFNTAVGCGAPGGGGPVLVNGGGGSEIPPSIPEGPQIVLKQTVGAFDVTVLQGGTAQEVSDWLEANGYQNIPTAPEILESYVAQDFVFAAIKLTGGAGVEEIHPLIVRYPGNEPCVPLKLTAVAAVENMGVRTFFLGQRRFVPVNYKHVALNPARLDWLNFGANYTDVVSRAVDSPVADGRAFVTEYAGPSSVVQRSGIYSESWRAAAFLDSEPEAAIDELSAQGLASCSGASCTFSHPLLLPLLNEFLPVPEGVDEGAFYSCLGCYSDVLDRTAWDGAEGDIPGRGFAEAFQERIIVPGRDANDLLDRYPYLTRMFTTISPAEMTEDPIFALGTGLGDVQALNVATQRLDSEGRSAFELGARRRIALGEDGTWPAFDELMPWADRIEEFSPAGEAIELVDNQTLVDILLDDWNAEQGYVEPRCGPITLGTGGTTTINPGGGNGGGGTSGIEPVTPEGAGCACRAVVPRSTAPAWALLVLPLSLVLRRRANRRR